MVMNDLAQEADRRIGKYVMTADENWRTAPFWRKALVWLLGRHHCCFIHLGYEFTTVELGGVTYLICAREAK